jgi:hypothetical protein
MAEDVYEQLMALDSLSKVEKQDLYVKRREVGEAQKAAFEKRGPDKAALEYMDRTGKLFHAALDSLQVKYLSNSGDPGGERFVNKLQAHNWLAAQGYKVSRAKFYGDCKGSETQPGFPPTYQDGSLSKFLVMQYAQQCDVETRGVGLVPAAVDNAENEARKLKAEADIAETKAKRMLREDDRLWLHADDAWASVAALIGVLRDAIRHHLYGSSREVIHLADGDQARSNEVFEAIDGVVSRAFNDVAGDEINVEFVRDVEAGE